MAYECIAATLICPSLPPLSARALSARSAASLVSFSIPQFSALPVSQHARHCKLKLTQVSDKVRCKAALVRWRTSREFCWPDTPSVTDMQQLSYSAQSPLVSARLYDCIEARNTFLKPRRPPYNQLLERTPPRCALRRRSTAR